ncbi:MAG: metal-sulfur cluster assembly factor [Muribaculaceae bacterium]|nr:metal-sulfur cluster assembly factor [Muribaculaceae bacterium]
METKEEKNIQEDNKVEESAPAEVQAEAAADDAYAITQKAIEMLKTVFDPEIPVNVYDLGLIYKIDYTPEDKILHVDMTLTAPGCPAADFILEDVRQKLLSVEGPKAVDLRLVFEPEWNQDMMSEEAKLELGFL